jgi:flavin-dependent dehydrogenase
MPTECDVVIVGGGPAGSTAATLLRKYAPDLHVLVLEKEKFPRDHVGESQLPPVCAILDEMGAWDKVEAAGFPVKIGASLTWGAKAQRFDLDFVPVEEWQDAPRPGTYEGQRRRSAFQVDRAIYDDILLRHAMTLGVEVHEGVKVDDVHVEGDAITGLALSTGETVTAKHYVDASGAVGLLRRKLGVESEAPKELRNIAIWDYWENAEWAVEIGVGATRVQVRSLPYGWIWFIPLGPTRTSIGLICPATYYRDAGLAPEELYHKALREQEEVEVLIRAATPRGNVETCRDWSHVADRLVGANWILCGEAAGFADPILAAGMTLAHGSARDAAYTILELERGDLDPAWLRTRYNDRHRQNIAQHIRFAQFWYSANGQFTDLQEHCANIAKEAGLRLSPGQAWKWLSQGGFSNESEQLATAGSFDVASTKQLLQRFDPRDREVKWLVDGYNVFKLELQGASTEPFGILVDGRIEQVECHTRGARRLPRAGIYGRMLEILEQTSDGGEIVEIIKKAIGRTGDDPTTALAQYFQALDVMIQDGWVSRKVNRKRPIVNVSNEGQRFMRDAEDVERALEEAGRSDSVKWNVGDQEGQRD